MIDQVPNEFRRFISPEILSLDTRRTSFPKDTLFEVKVLASFPVNMSVHLRIPHDARAAEKEGLVDEEYPLYGTYNAVTMHFGVTNPNLADYIATLVDRHHGFTQLLYYLHLKQIDLKAPIYDETDLDDRNLILNEFGINPKVHYLLLSDGVEIIVFGNNGIAFPPGRAFKSRSGRVHKKGMQKGKTKLASNSERSAATYHLRLITHFPPSAMARYELTNNPSGSHELYSRIHLGEERFKRTFLLDYEAAKQLKVDQVIDGQYPLTAAFDPDYSFLSRNSKNQNVLTDYRDISIPLFWPDWSDERLSKLRMLESWGQCSYEALVRFLNGMKVDRLEDFVASERLRTEDIPKERGVSKKLLQSDRDGQCYRGEYQTLSVLGPYFLFELRLNGKSLFLLDSPFYGIALRAFEEKQFALDYIAGGERRDRSAQHLLWRIVHDKIGNWRNQLAKLIQDYLQQTVAFNS